VNADNEWRWADPLGQQRLVRTDELRAALASGVIAPNTPVWKVGWEDWKPAYDVPELTLSAVSSANGVVPNIPPPPLFIVAAQHSYEDKGGPPSPAETPHAEPPPPPRYVPSQTPPRTSHSAAPIATTALPTLVMAHALAVTAAPTVTAAEASPAPSKVASPLAPPPPPVEPKRNVPSKPPLPPTGSAANGSASRVRVATPHATMKLAATEAAGHLPEPPEPPPEPAPSPKVPDARPSVIPPDESGWDETDAEPIPLARPSETLAGAMRPPRTGEDANTGVDITALSPADAERLLAVTGPANATLIQGGGLATVHGVPALEQPSAPALPPPPPLRPSSVPPAAAAPATPEAPGESPFPPRESPGTKLLTPAYGQGQTVPILPLTPHAPHVIGSPGTTPSGRPAPVRSSKPPPPLRKRGQTLMLYGGAPRDADTPAEEAKAAEASPINVPAPGAQAPKAVTQAPPWTEGSAKFDPTIPKAPLPNLPPMRGMLDSIEEITGSVLLSEDSSADVTQKKPKIEDLSDSHVLPADASGPAMQIPPAPLLPVVPAPPPMSEQPRSEDFATIPLAARGAAIPATIPAGPPAETSSSSPSAPVDAPRESHVPVPPPSASRRIVHDLNELWAQPESRWKVGAIAVGSFVVLIGVVSIVRAVSGPGSAETAKNAVISAVPSAPSTAEPATTEGRGAAPGTASGAKSIASTAACVNGSVAHIIAPRAQIRVGVETATSTNRIGLGFAASEKEGLAVSLDPTSLTASGLPAKSHSKETIKRLVPVFAGKGLSAIIDADHKGEPMLGARSANDGSFVLGASEGKLAWASRATDAPHAVFPLEGDEPVEALRAVPLSQGGYAVAFRQGTSIYVGAMSADKSANGALSRIAGLGPQIGSPALAASGGSALVVWADRAGTTDPWMLRVLRFQPGQPLGAPRPFVIPPGGLGEQAMSPGITSVSGDRFLLSWTEGPVSSHQVRAQTLSAAGDPLGTPMTISGEGINAGQGQPAVLADGRGLVVYLASPTGGTGQVVATPVSCPLSTP
jgi:hypothetical protein